MSKRRYTEEESLDLQSKLAAARADMAPSLDALRRKLEAARTNGNIYSLIAASWKLNHAEHISKTANSYVQRGGLQSAVAAVKDLAASDE